MTDIVTDGLSLVRRFRTLIQKSGTVNLELMRELANAERGLKTHIIDHVSDAAIDLEFVSDIGRSELTIGKDDPAFDEWWEARNALLDWRNDLYEIEYLALPGERV